MTKLLLAALCLFPAAFANAEGTDAATPAAPKAGVPVETVKVTDQNDQGLFERVRDTYVRAEKKGLLAAVTPPAQAK